MNRPRIVVDLTNLQNEQIKELTYREFSFDPRKFTLRGLLVAQPDTNTGKMEVAVFHMWEARILVAAIEILSILRGFQSMGKKHLDEDGFFTLEDV